MEIKKLTFKQLATKLNGIDINFMVNTLDQNPDDLEEKDEIKEWAKIVKKLGSFESVDSSGVHENEHYTEVIHFKDHDLYVRFHGYYTSYEGLEMNSRFEQVFPKEVTVTEFFTEIK